MINTPLILAVIGAVIGKLLLGCLLFFGVVWVGMLVGKRNDEMKRLKKQNEELLKKQKYKDAHIKHLRNELNCETED